MNLFFRRNRDDFTLLLHQLFTGFLSGGGDMSKRLEEHTHMAVRINEYEKIKEQAERVQELEEFYEEMLAEATILNNQNKRYREAIYSAERKCDGEANSILKRALLESESE